MWIAQTIQFESGNVANASVYDKPLGHTTGSIQNCLCTCQQLERQDFDYVALRLSRALGINIDGGNLVVS